MGDPFDALTLSLLHAVEEAWTTRGVCHAWREVVDAHVLPPLLARADAYADALRLRVRTRGARLRFGAQYHRAHACAARPSPSFAARNVAFTPPAHLFTTFDDEDVGTWLWRASPSPCCAWTRRGTLCARTAMWPVRLCAAHARHVPFLVPSTATPTTRLTAERGSRGGWWSW